MSTTDEKPKARKFSLPRIWSNGFRTLGNVVAFVVACGTFLMAISLLAGPDATREVLPFVTGLVGFLGGLVIAMYSAERNDAQYSAFVKDDKSVGMA
ncbi:MAG: hypothetical protein ACR2IS_10950 [Nitrososphaeraceae archaeon]